MATYFRVIYTQGNTKAKIIVGRNLRYVYINSEDNKLKTTNVITITNIRDLNLPIRYNSGTIENIRINNVNYKENYMNDFLLKSENKITNSFDKPKFYRIKNQCIYNPKEYKYKKPNIKIGEKYGKDYSILKVYD